MQRALIQQIQRSKKFASWRTHRKFYYKDEATGHPALEKHYRPSELATVWGLSVDTIRAMFEREPGVLKHGTNQKGKRRYVTLRIPETIAVRVHNRLSP